MVMLEDAEASVPSPASLLARPIHFGVHHTHVSGQCIIATEGLLLSAEMASHLLLARIVDRIFMSGKIVGPREDRIAWLASRRVDPLTLVRTSLRVAKRGIPSNQVTTRGRLAMRLTLVSLELGGSLEAESATVVGASVGTSIRRSVVRSNDSIIDRQLGLRSHSTRVQLAARRFQSRKRRGEVINCFYDMKNTTLERERERERGERE